MTGQRRPLIHAALLAAVLVPTAPSPSRAQWAVFDGAAAANAVAQATRMAEQIRAMESQLGEAKRL